MMPGIDGLGVLEGLGAIRPPVVLLSGNDEPEVLLSGRQMGVEAHLIKPVGLEDLYSTVGAVLTAWRDKA